MSHRRAKKIRFRLGGKVKSTLPNPGTHFVLDGFKPGTGHYVTNTVCYDRATSDRPYYQFIKEERRPNVRSQQP